MGRYFAAVAIAINYFQILYIFKSLFMNWSSTVVQMFEIFSVFSFNIELASPECINPAINYFSKGEFMFMLPPCIFIMLIMFCFLASPPCTYPLIYIKALIKKEKHPIYPEISMAIIENNMYNAVRAFHILLQFMYVSLTSWALGYFNCYQFGDKMVLSKAPVYECYTGLHQENLGYFTAAIIFYVVGIPVYFSSIYLIIYQTKVKTPFALKLKNLFQKIIRNNTSIYKAETQFVVSAQLLMKLVIMIVQNFMSDQISSQAVIIQLAIFTYIGFLIYFKPYVERDHTIADVLCQVCSVLTIGAGILFLTNTNPTRIVGLTSIVVTVTMVCVVASVLFIAKDIHRGKRVLTTKREEKRKSEEIKAETLKREVRLPTIGRTTGF